jgi:hypothetical protein
MDQDTYGNAYAFEDFLEQLVSRERQRKFLLVDIGASKGNRYKIAGDATKPNYI